MIVTKVTLALQSMIKLLGRMFGAKFWDNAVFFIIFIFIYIYIILEV